MGSFNNNKPLVSISCIAFNHVKFIEKALNGFLMQKTNFNFEVLIHDDASTDGTEEIIREFENNFPSVIKPLYEETNQWVKGRKGSAVFNFPRAQGKYIALCEGDDYWTDPLKLQKQVDFLEANEDFSACFHNATIENTLTNKSYLYHQWFSSKEISANEAIVVGGYVFPTASLVFRRFNFDNFNLNAPAGDLEILLNLVLEGKLFYFSDVMCVYRRHENGIYSGILKNKDKLVKQEKLIIKFLSKSINDLPNEYQLSLKKHIRNKIKRLFKEYNSSFIYLLKVSNYLSKREIVEIAKGKTKRYIK